MTSRIRRAWLLAGIALLAACETGGGTDFEGDAGWGEANRQTMAAQVINPNPEYTDPIPPTSADNAVDAIDRLREGRVEQPERVSTTESISD
jgi:hypothetical protein